MTNKQGVRNPPSKEEGLKALRKYLEHEDKRSEEHTSELQSH